VWAHVERSLANLDVVALDRLETLVRNRLKRLQYRPDTLDGFIAGTGLTQASAGWGVKDAVDQDVQAPGVAVTGREQGLPE
jgi:hypothetical protein